MQNLCSDDTGREKTRKTEMMAPIFKLNVFLDLTVSAIEPRLILSWMTWRFRYLQELKLLIPS
jgi:hypothetical protein